MTKDIIIQFELFVRKNNWTQTEAAEKIGCSQEHLSRIFRGIKNPSVKLLDRMEKIMELSDG
ncbi:MAG: helix-turn-helix transcriptional regulator [Romboutsia sp.]|nr:helix-turn-helix transcriptional regulator [Romboutsia sp.]